MVYNSLGFEREEYICFHIDINIKNWVIKDSSGSIMNAQLNYLWNGEKLVTDQIEACFITTLPSLSITRFTIEQLIHDLSGSHSVSRVELINYDDQDVINQEINNFDLIKRIDHDTKPEEITIENNDIKLVFSSVDGLLKRVIQLDQQQKSTNSGGGDVFKSHEVKLSFRTFSTSPSKKDHRSGAYLFLPGNFYLNKYILPVFNSFVSDTKEAIELDQVKEPKIKVTRGQLCSTVQVMVESPLKIVHEVSLINNFKSININNEFHLVKGSVGNKELLLRIETEIENGQTFYTDLNGFQVIIFIT